MINRDNYALVNRNLDYRGRILQNDEATVRTYWQSLKHLLKWADTRSFKDAPKIMPPFPEYLLTARNESYAGETIEKRLTPKYMGKVLSHCRAFFDWAREHERGFGEISEAWIKTLVPRRSAGEQSRLREHAYWRLENIRKITTLPPANLREQRDIAALAFLFLSGMRIGAFVTLPADCVDIARRKVKQLPELGVQTKNDKAAVTTLYPLLDLLAIVEKWDGLIKSLPGDYNWYAPFRHDGTSTTLKDGLIKGRYNGRVVAFIEGLKALCIRAGVPYLSPHKIRHGFGVYGVKKSQNMAQLKAVSQNLMHQNIGITDGIYGQLGEDDLSEILAGFGDDPKGE